jgi:segregation and condensation protein A
MMEGAAFTRASMDEDKDNPEIAATVFQLFEVFKEVMDRRKAISEIEIARDEMTMAEKIAEITLMLNDSAQVSARALFERAGSRREMVLIFLSVLELVKGLVIRLTQRETFGDIVIVKRDA